jgi:type I restriction enzyme, S subunit
MTFRPLSEVPFSHPWAEKTLGQIATVVVGGTPSTDIQAYWGGEVAWMASGDVNLKHITSVEGRITGLGLSSSNATLVEPPAVAVALAGQGKTRGTVAKVLTHLCTNQSVALIAGKPEELHPDYLFHNLDFRYEELRARSSGGGRGGLSKGILEATPIPIPDYAEQTRIAEVLDNLDEVIQGTERSIAKLRRLQDGLLLSLVAPPSPPTTWSRTTLGDTAD